MKRLAMTLASLVISLHCQAQGIKTLSVDERGERVVLSGAPSVWTRGNGESRLFRLSAGTWTEAQRFDSPGWQPIGFLADELLIESQRQAVVDGALVPRSERIGSRPGMPMEIQGQGATFVHGSQVLAGIDGFPASPLKIVQPDGQGWSTVAELEAPPGLPWIISPVHIAFDGKRVAMLLMPLGERCGLLVYEKGDEAWSRTGPLFPAVCRDGSHAGGSLSLDGEQIAIGVYPFPHPEGPAGEVALLTRGSGDWAEATRIKRPTIEDDYSEDGMQPYAFGHRVQLAGGRLYVGTGYQIIRSHQEGVGTQASVVHNGVMVFARKPGEWTIVRNLVHAHPTATFGDSFEVRGNRLFIDSPLEDAAYVFVRGEDRYILEARLPAETEAPPPEPDAHGAEPTEPESAGLEG